jgi:hypothetical protein
MCLSNEALDELHAITSSLKTVQSHRDLWLEKFDAAMNGEVKGDELPESLVVTRAEAERIFADRIAALEAKLKEQGWTRTIRVEPTQEVAK